MEISTSSNNVTVMGNIKSVSDFQAIKRVLDNLMTSHKSILINIGDSLSITSSVIGYLNKLVLEDKIDIRLSIGNDGLLRLLDDLNLVSTFKAQRSLQ